MPTCGSTIQLYPICAVDKHMRATSPYFHRVGASSLRCGSGAVMGERGRFAVHADARACGERKAGGGQRMGCCWEEQHRTRCCLLMAGGGMPGSCPGGSARLGLPRLALAACLAASPALHLERVCIWQVAAADQQREAADEDVQRQRRVRLLAARQQQRWAGKRACGRQLTTTAEALPPCLTQMATSCARHCTGCGSPVLCCCLSYNYP